MTKPLTCKTLAPFVMELSCRKCTRAEEFHAASEEAAIRKAVGSGWVRDGEAYICPRCPVLANRGGDRVA